MATAARAAGARRDTVVGPQPATGIVTRVVRDTVMAQVEIGPAFRLVSLMSREAADELELEPGVRAVATVKAAQVSVDVPDRRAGTQLRTWIPRLARSRRDVADFAARADRDGASPPILEAG